MDGWKLDRPASPKSSGASKVTQSVHRRGDCQSAEFRRPKHSRPPRPKSYFEAAASLRASACLSHVPHALVRSRRGCFAVALPRHSLRAMSRSAGPLVRQSISLCLSSSDRKAVSQNRCTFFFALESDRRVADESGKMKGAVRVSERRQRACQVQTCGGNAASMVLGDSASCKVGCESPCGSSGSLLVVSLPPLSGLA